MANQYRSVLAGGAGTGGDAVASEVLSGKTFTNDNGPQTGSMPNRGAVSGSATPSTPYTIPEGYHNGEGSVIATGAISGYKTATITTGNTSYTFDHDAIGFIIDPSATMSDPKINNEAITMNSLSGSIFVTGDGYTYIGNIHNGDVFSASLGGYQAHLLIIE